MENIILDSNEPLYNDSDLLFNSYYNFLYDDFDLLFNAYHNSSNPTFELFDSSHDSLFSLIFEFYDHSHDSSNLVFLEDLEIYNKIQVDNDMMDIIVRPANETIVGYDGNIDHNHEKYDDHDSEHVEKEENKLKLHKEMEFKTWKLAELYLDEYAKQQGFYFRKKKTFSPATLTITRRRTYECSHVQTYEPQKIILAENRRDRDSEIIGCFWHINLAFPKSASGVKINSIVGEHNYNINPLIVEIASKFQKLTNEMLKKVKFWTIQERIGMITQYNLLVALFPNKIINKKDLSNAIQQFKKQVKSSKNDAYQMLTK
ncbi:unnamed protein product [Rhizophagus irregularis]|nr:unnamed protein product [Rhizophagus irregularis]